MIPIDGVVVDIGAHAGQFSKLFAKMARKGEVYAFEPSAYARSVMAPAVGLNRLRNITLIAKGLGERSEPLVLHTPLKRQRSLGFGTAHIGASQGPTVDQTIEMTTLDEFVAERAINRLDLIKADVEGWELRALKGGEAALRKYTPALYLEVDGALMGRAGDTPADLFDFLGQLGYRGFTTPTVGPAPAYEQPGDYLFLPKSKALTTPGGIDYIAIT